MYRSITVDPFANNYCNSLLPLVATCAVVNLLYASVIEHNFVRKGQKCVPILMDPGQFVLANVFHSTDVARLSQLLDCLYLLLERQAGVIFGLYCREQLTLNHNSPFEGHRPADSHLLIRYLILVIYRCHTSGVSFIIGQ